MEKSHKRKSLNSWDDKVDRLSSLPDTMLVNIIFNINNQFTFTITKLASLLGVESVTDSE